MLFRRSAPALLISAGVFVVVAITGVGLLLTATMLESSEAASYKLMRDVLTNSAREYERSALNRAELVSASPAVRRAFQERDRAKLLAETQEMFKEQVDKYGLDQAQFHVPPGVSFLRLHKPEKFGDDQTAYRPMLTEVHREKVIRRGVEVTRAGPAITGIAPMIDDKGEQIGSLEMGLDFPPLLDRLKTAYGLEAAAFFEEKMLREISTDMPAEAFASQNRVGKYILYHATHPALMKSLVKDSEVGITDPKRYERRVSGAPWGVQLVPMYNYQNKQIGVYAVAMDFTETRGSEGRSRVWQGLAALFAIVLLAGAVMVVVRGLLLAPLGALNERMAALADGDASKPADPLDSYCDELRTLATNYEKLRAERQP